MFTDEEATEDDGAGGQTRYPVMPSLVALQQMKNRLHLAFLGKKLMKWTAMATGKELRKLATEINLAFENYGAEFSKAFMLLARCRYFHPDVNTMVVHNVGKQAASIVQIDYRSVAGVKVLELELVEKGFDPNEHLGIGRGGSTIQETKRCWRELLRLAVLMLQQRTAFKMLYDANKSANKKQNVLAKLVIPKIQKAIAYINAELEEREREETFRLKRFKQKKDKKAAKIKEVVKLDEEPYVEAEPDIIVQEPKPKPPQKSCGCAMVHPNQYNDEKGNFDCPICKLAERNVAIKIAPCTLCLPAVKEAEHRLKHLMAHVNQVLLLSKQHLLTEIAPCCKEDVNENEGGELNYAVLKKQIDIISVTCTCPHKEPDIQSEDSCTCEPPCQCDDPPKFKDCCGGPEKDDVARSGSEFQTYNLCSIYGSSSCPQSMATGLNFRNSSKNYPAVPPFFYLYTGPYVRSETGFHSIQSKSAKTSNKGLDAAPCKNELTQVKPPCPCAPMDEKKICSCEALSPRQSEHPCVCNSTEILYTQKPPSRQSEAVGGKGTCPSCQAVASLHAPNPATDLAKRITRLSEPCLKIKISVSGYLPVTKSIDPETAKKSENNLNRVNPIKRANANLKVTTSSLGHLVDDNNTQTKTCSCKSMVEKASTEIISQQSSEDLCSCGSTETLVPIVLQSSSDHYNTLLSQSDVVEMICKGIFQTDQPATSLPPPTLSIELAERVAKASEPYLKKKISLNKAFPVDEIEEVPKYPTCYLKSVMSKKSTCSCESLEQTKSCSCKSMQSCPCGVSDESSRGSNSSEDLSNKTSGPPYFKRPATFFTAVPQKFTPLLSYTQKKNIGPYNCRNITDTILLRGTSISNDFADQYLTFNPYTRDQNYKNNIFSETSSITGSFNKKISKQAAYLSPYTREGKPGPCGISEVSYVACPLSNTVSKQSSAYSTYLLKENSAYFPTYTQLGKQLLCSHSQISSMGATLDDIVSIASYTAELKSEYCDISETGSITNEFYAIDSKQCTTSLTYTLAENAAITEIDQTSKSLDATVCKDFSIYISMNHQNNLPYIVYTQQCNNACGSRETTDLPVTPKCKDCSTYVTVIRKRPVPYTREGRPGPCGVCEMIYQTYFVISEDCATYVTTVPKKNPEEQSCGSLSTITTSSSPFSINYATCSNCDTLLPQKEKIDECSICRIVKLSRQFEDFAPFTQSSEYSDNLTLNNDIDLSDSEIYKICNACNPIPKHIEPYTREGIPGPCGVDEKNDSVGNQSNVDIIPYTREEIAKLCGVSETNAILRSLTNIRCTEEGISGPCGVSNTCNMDKCSCNSDTKPIPNVETCFQERKPGSCKVPDTNIIAGSRCNAAPKCLIDVNPCTREATRPCGFTKINHIEDADSIKVCTDVGKCTRKKKPGPCCGSCCIPETDRYTGATCISIPKSPPYVGVYLQERTPRSCCVSEPNPNTGATSMKTHNILPDVEAFKRDGKLRPSCLSEPNQNAGATCMKSPRTLPCDEAYTRKGTPGPCCLSEPNQNAGATCMKSPRTLPCDEAYTRKGTPGPCCLSEPNQNAGATCMKSPRTLPCDEAYTRKGTPGPCCLSEPNQNAGATCMKSHRTLPCDEAYTRKGTPGPCCLSEPNQNAGATCMKSPRTLPCDEAYTRKGTPGPCCLSEPNQNAGATCMKSSRTLPCDEAYTRKGTPGPCCLSEPNKDAGASCMKSPRTLPCDEAYTRKGTPGPCCLSEPNQDAGASCMKSPRTLPCDVAYTRKGTPEPCCLSEIKQDADATCMRNTKISTEVGAFTREGTPGPCGISETNSNAGAMSMKIPRPLPCDKAYTREGAPGPCGVSNTNHIEGLDSNRVPETVLGGKVNTQEGTQELKVTETNKTAGTPDSRPTSNDEPNTHEDTQEPSSATNKDQIIGFFYNTTLHPPSSLDFKSNRNAGYVRYTVRKLLSHLRPSTRETTPMPCSVPETSHIADVNSIRVPETLPGIVENAREVISGPYGVTETHKITSSVCSEDSHPPSNVELHTREETRGPYCISNKDHIVGYFYNTRLKPSSDFRAYTREDIPDHCGVSKTYSIAGSSYTARELLSDLGPYTVEKISGSQGVFDTDHIADADSITVSEPPLAIGAYKREETSGFRDIAKTNGVKGSIRNMIPKFFSRPYTQEGIPGPCGGSEKGYKLRSCANSIPTNVKPYTRENQPGPCGISYEASNSSFSVTSSNRMLENQSKRWNNSRIYKNGTSQLRKLESYTRQDNRGPYCETQSCMMCLTTPCTLEGLTRQTGNHNTKDAVTYVTLVPRLVSCTREAVPGSCSTCKTRNTHQAESSKSSAYSCKTRVPHIRINDTRSLHSIFPASCSSCKPPATASEATSMLLPSYILAIPSSTKTSGTCCCKSSRLSTATLGCGPSYNESDRYIAPKNGCSICGRAASKLNTHMMSVSYLTSLSHGNSDTVGSTSLKSQPCSGCGKATLVMSCASNPSVKSVAIGTCETYFTSSKRNPIPKLLTKSSHCHFGKTKAIQQCCNKGVQNSSSEESTNSSESENCASEDCKTSEKTKEDTRELGFGYFEIAFKKITKICKYKNPDGTVTDEKRIITVETTKKRPQTSEDFDIEEGTSIGCSLENETNSIANNNICKCKSVRNAKSETVQGNIEIDICPKIRRCISVQNCKNVKEQIIIVPKSCIANSLPKCPHRLHDSDNDSKCKCDKKLNENARISCDKSTSASCLSTQQDACTVVRTKNHQSNDSKPKCQGGNAPCLAPTRKICPKRYKCLDDTPKSDCAKSDYKSTTSTCTDEPQDIKSEPKCSCTNNSQPEPTEPEDSDDGPKCDFTSRQVQESHDKEQQTHDSDSAKCKPPPNKPEDSENGPKCDCVKKSESKPTPPVCCRQEDSETEPKCDCAKARKSFSKATAPICPISVQVTDSKPADNVVFLVPSGQICTNNFQVLDNSPKSDCACKSPQKLIAPICVHGLHDTKSGPKCSCTKNATSNPVCPNRLKNSNSSPKHVCPNLQPKPEAVCAEKEHDSKSGLKCKCEKSHRPSDAACNNILQKTDSDIRCEYFNKMLHKSTSPVCAFEQQNVCTGVCGDPQKDSENEPKFKFEDGNAVLIVPTIKTCTDNCESKSHRKSSTPISTVEPQDMKTEKKCSCRKSQSKPTVPVCSNKHQSDSSPKCKCRNKSPPKSSVPVCPNKTDDIDNKPKCACANKTPSKPIPLVCANRLEDSDSGPKCDCPNETPKPTTPECANRIEDTDSGPKCDCASHPSNSVSNNKKNSGCDPMCELASKILPMLVSKGQPDNNKVTNRKAKGTEDNFIFLALTGKGCTISHLKPTAPEYANRLEDSDNSSECYCENQSPPKTSYSLCSNKLEDSKPISPICANGLQNSDSGSKCECADVTPSVKDTETETALDLCNVIETSDNSNKLPAIKSQNDKAAGRVLDLHNVKGDGNLEEKSQEKPVFSSPQKVAGVLDLHDENDKDNCEGKLPSAKTQDYKLPAVTLQNEKVAGRVLDLHDVKGDGNREEKTQDKEVSCSPQVEGGRILDLHNLKDNCDHEEPSTKLQNQEREERGNKLLSTKTQDRKISCSSLERETGIVIDLNDLKEIEKEEICTCRNVCKCDKSHSKKPEEAGRVVNLNNCKCKAGLLSATAQIQEIYGILHGIVGKVIDTHGIKENRNCGSKVSSAKRQNKEVCCSLQPEKGIIVDLRDKKNKRNLDKKSHSITCHGGSGMVLNLNNAKDNCENRLNEYTVPSKRTLCKPIQKTDIAMSTTGLYSKPKATCVPTSTKIDSNSCCPVKIIPKPRKICCCTATHDASKLSIFKGVSMMDALRQLFQHSNSRTQKVQDKNICKACYSPLSNSDEVECLCDNCKEKLIDENERHYRCTNYSTEPGTPCKNAPSLLSHRFCISKNNFRSNTEDEQCYQTPFAIKTPSMDSDTCLNCAEHDSCCNDVATSTKSRDISYVRVIKKGKIEHGCTKCGTRDGESHSRHKS